MAFGIMSGDAFQLIEAGADGVCNWGHIMEVRIKRVYEPYEESDGYRVLVDRLWPRGLTKERVHYNVWEKGIAPSTELRRWFGHDPAKWDEFKKRYVAELNANPEAAPLLPSSPAWNWPPIHA